jgi:hypothetical protein
MFKGMGNIRTEHSVSKGVACADCHDPHKLESRGRDNELYKGCPMAERHVTPSPIVL